MSDILCRLSLVLRAFEINGEKEEKTPKFSRLSRQSYLYWISISDPSLGVGGCSSVFQSYTAQFGGCKWLNSRGLIHFWEFQMSVSVDKVADALFKSGCLKFGSFRIKSGAMSPYYIDLASLLSSPKEMCSVAKAAARRIETIQEFEEIDKLASIELKGALLLPLIACKVNLPSVVVQ